MRRILFPALLVAILFAQLGATAAQGRRTALRSGAVVKTALNKKLGKTILVDAAGLALYEFESDYGGRPGCVNDSTYHCSKHWVPLLTTGQPHAVGAVKQALLGTVKRPDAGVQVTYRHHPLYIWKGGYGTKGDARPGDINGQGFGAQWFVLAPNGVPIQVGP